MQIPFVGGAYLNRSSNLNIQNCINLFPVIGSAAEQAKVPVSLRGTPGLTSIYRPIATTGLPVRAMYSIGTKLYAVIKEKVYSLTSAGVGAYIGDISTSTGYVSMESNGTQVILVDGTSYGYIITIATDVMTVITDSDFPTATSVTFQDGYFIVVKKGTQSIYISGLYDGNTWNALDFAAAEGRPDNLVAALSNTTDLWLFGETSTEVFYNSGNSDFPFVRVGGALIDVGCAAIASPVKIDGRMYWLSNTGRVCRAIGYQQQYISTESIDYAIASYSVTSDAIGSTYTIDNSTFYVLTFPTAGKTWVYDTVYEFWHEWSSYITSNTYGRHRINCCVRLGVNWVIGDYDNGTIYKLDMTCFTDNTYLIKRQRTGQVINKDMNRVICHALEVDMEKGVGINTIVITDPGYDPQVILTWSDDSGHTWSTAHTKSFGKYQDYKKSVIWRSLGQARNRVYRLTITEPVKVEIFGLYAELEECLS
jgi:hypothetical protein